MIAKLKKIIIDLFCQHSTPNGVALGLAVGVFIGVLPLYGLHTLLVVIAALVLRPANKVAIFLGTNISLPPTIPFITWLAYEIGRLVLWGKFDPLTWADFKNITFHKIATHYKPLLIGSVILGFVCAAIVYLFAFFIIREIRIKKQHGAGM